MAHNATKTMSEVAEDTTQSLSSSLLTLPAEIRNKILTHLFYNAKLGIATIHTGSQFALCGSFCECAFPWHIVNTCRQLRHEATPMLLAATTLEVTSRTDKVSTLPDLYLAHISHVIFLDTRLPRDFPDQLVKFSSLLTLELRNITIFCKFYDDEFFMQDHANECMFDMAMFNLGRSSPVFLKICRDPERKFKVLLGCQYVVTSDLHETVKAVINVDTKEILHKTRSPAIGTRNAWAGFY